MRKTASLLAMLLLFAAVAFGQAVTVKGTVKNETGEVVPFASVTETGTKNGTTADANGVFSLKINSGSTITVTAANHEPMVVTPVAGIANVVLKSTGNLEEVVVTTALGVKRRPKEIGYANSTIKAEQITAGNSPTLGQALSGKVAGLTIQNTTSGVSKDVRITLRGNRSITGNNEALIVLDGVPVPQNTISYINPNDVENVTVLKGGQAATLYGSDGVNGVIMITTKKGTGKPTVTFTHSTEWERISFMPDFQTGFGSGSDYGGTPNTIENFRPFENQQYGDAFNGQNREQGRVLSDGTWLELPYSAIKNQKKDAFNTGHVNQTGITYTAGDENSRFLLSAMDYTATGVVPGDKYRRDNVRFNASRSYGKFKASFDGTFVLDRTETTTSSFYFNVLNVAANIPLNLFRNWRTDKFASPNGYYNDYYPNPYFSADNNRRDSRNNILNGNINLEFKPLSWLSANYRLGAAYTNNFRKDWTGQFLFSAYSKTAKTHSPEYNDYNGIYYANTNILGSVLDYSSYGSRLNSDFWVTLDKSFNKFTGKLILGNSIQQRQSKGTQVSSSSVVVPGLYNIENRAGTLEGGTNNAFSNTRKFGNFADLTVGYNDFLFLHGTARNDRTSVFYSDTATTSTYSYWYYGADLSLSLTDAMPSLKSDVLSFLKLRVGYNTNRNDNIGAYDIQPTYGNATGFPYGTIVGLTTSNTYPSPNLKPEAIKTVEAGFEAAFFKNRLNVDFSYYNQKVEDAIITAGVSSATGYTNFRTNAANMTNKGAEVEVRATIIRSRDFTWDVNANYTYNTNKVTKVFQDLPRFQSAAYSTYGYLFAEVGQAFPYLKTTGFQKDSLGRTIVSAADGWPLRDPNLIGQGNTLPKHTIGFGTRLTYKNFTVSTNLEMRTGYVIYNAIGHDMAFTGSAAITAQYGREPFLYPNSSVADGTGKYVANTQLVDAAWAWYDGWGNVGQPRAATQIGELYVTSGRFIKMRDASIAYNVPQSLLGKTKFIKGATITLTGRNLFTLLPSANMYTDPEFSATATNSNAQGINSSALNAPPTRAYGFSVNVNF